MYKKHLRSWGLKKHIGTAEMTAMLQIAEQRRRENKETLFARRGRPVDPEKLRRFAKRYRLPVGGSLSSSDQRGMPRSTVHEFLCCVADNFSSDNTARDHVQDA